jgi:hypothetical protein
MMRIVLIALAIAIVSCLLAWAVGGLAMNLRSTLQVEKSQAMGT